MIIQEMATANHLQSRPLAHASQVQAVELFTGCGGMALGLSRAGINHRLMVEFNAHAAETIKFNAARSVDFVREWPFVQDDVRNIDWSKFRGIAKIVAGGPPCQPFSVGGRATGHADSRDMWPEAIRAVREIEPDLFIFENVRGLLRPAFAKYVEWIKTFLSSPHLQTRGDDSYAKQLSRVAGTREASVYDVSVFPVNAASFGAPQKRHRVFFVGIRRSLGVQLGAPAETHSQNKLVWDKWVTGEYWDKHKISRRKRRAMSPESRILESFNGEMFAPEGNAWVTCRDAFIGLGEPTVIDDGRNHRLQPGARSYAGHTGSPLDEPAKALKAGVHGVPGGENMLFLDSGKVRYLTIREAARLQGLPDDYVFPGSWTESMRQIGNAVPAMLASRIAEWVVNGAYCSRLKKVA